MMGCLEYWGVAGDRGRINTLLFMIGALPLRLNRAPKLPLKELLEPQSHPTSSPKNNSQHEKSGLGRAAFEQGDDLFLATKGAT